MGKPYNGGQSPWTVYHLILEKYEDDDVELRRDSESGEDRGNMVDGIRTIDIQIDTDKTITCNRISPLSINESNWKTNSVVVNCTRGQIIKRGDRVLANDGQYKRVLIAREITPTPSGIVRPKYLFDTDRVEMDSFDEENNRELSFYGYNSVSRLGLLSAEFFTELFIVFNDTGNFTDAGLDRNWIIGGIVVGEESNAVGQVEVGSDGNKLVLSSIVGIFRNGENIRQVFASLSDADIFLQREGGPPGADRQTLIESLSNAISS